MLFGLSYKEQYLNYFSIIEVGLFLPFY